MKFLILGCNGMAGHTISIYLKEKGHDVLGFARTQSAFVKTICGDARDGSFLKEVILNAKADSVINCIGVLNQFAEAEKADAVYLNAYLPHFISEITERAGVHYIHMSTDCVFSGKVGQYTEDSLRDGETFYDRTKALGEVDGKNSITLRNSIIGPDINRNGIGLVNWFMQQKTAINGYTKAIWTGQTTLQLAKTMEAAASQKATGIYNMVPETSISKYELLKLVNKFCRNDEIKINPVEGVSLDKSLKRTNFNFGLKIPDYETMIKEMAEWMQGHKDLYPHYYGK